MPHRPRSYGLQHVQKPCQVAVNVILRMSDRVAYTGLSGQMHNVLNSVLLEYAFNCRGINDVNQFKYELRIRAKAFQSSQTCTLQLRVVLIVQVIHAYNMRSALQ